MFVGVYSFDGNESEFAHSGVNFCVEQLSLLHPSAVTPILQCVLIVREMSSVLNPMMFSKRNREPGVFPCGMNV